MSRIAVVKKERCNPQGCGNYLCMRLCPINRQQKDCIAKDTDNKIKIDEGLCIGCMICVHKCPYEAIDIINLPEELTRKPVHRYGRNGFHLYNIPVPQAGQTIGIMGRNGMGKSTTVNILSGTLKPNLGKDSDEGANEAELQAYFRGTVAWQFFEKRKKSSLTLSVKPQHVDAIPKVVSGTVHDVLSKVASAEKITRVAEALSLKHLMHQEVSKLSGGELQRLAIAAASLKTAQVYFFDEPSSFLDIKQRLAMAKFVKGLSKEDTSVMVIEHDLVVMDVLSDLVHIVFGKPGSYGIVSQPYNSRVGMNAFMEGFLKSENMRFRNYPITFSTRPEVNKKRQFPLLSWSDLELKQGQFHFKANAGDLMNCEVIGVVGENGIGKTTFVKLLANQIKAQKGEINAEVSVSYKPQYLDAKREEPVRELLRNAVGNYMNELIKPLELMPLLDRKVTELSGGELQRVEIARCLAEDAQLYLIDEPSAYLDVEHRLTVSKIIRDWAEKQGKCVLVVDHDLVLIDYVSDRLLVFEGKPGLAGSLEGIFSMDEGMNKFLEGLQLTFRRDDTTKRPRANKQGSQLDREQAEQGKRYYTD